MNKRQKLKNIKNQNLSIMKGLFADISRHFTPYRIQYGDGYFLSTFGPCSVAHFRIKEIPDWRFGIWVRSPKHIELFGEHVTLVDKFKPSRTHISEWTANAFCQELLFVQQHPKIAYTRAAWGDENIPGEDTESYSERRWQEMLADRRFNTEMKASALKIMKGQLQRLADHPHVEAVLATDLNREGMRSSPRYYILVVPNKGMTHDQHRELYNGTNDSFREAQLAWETEWRQKGDHADFNDYVTNYHDFRLRSFLHDLPTPKQLRDDFSYTFYASSKEARR